MTESDLNIAISKFVDAILALVQDDPHQWSSRPCPTCKAITSLRGKPFGCYEYQAQVWRSER